MKDIVNGMPVGVAKAKCEESDDDVDEIGEDDDDCLEPKKRTTPAKRKRQSQEQDARDDMDDRSSCSAGGGNKPFKPPRSLDLFQNRVKGATTAKPKPTAASKKKQRVLQDHVCVSLTFLPPCSNRQWFATWYAFLGGFSIEERSAKRS